MNLEQLSLKCPCGGKMEKTNLLWRGISVRAWKCPSCKEELIHPVDAQKALTIEKAKKEKKLRVKLRRVGKSDVITLPAILKEMENLKTGQSLEWSIKDGKLVLSY